MTEEDLRHEYIGEGQSRGYISEKYGVPKTKIGNLLQKYGIRRHHVVRHGLSKHPLNIIWHGMKERCLNPNAENYKWYGERGITVCQEWTQDFTAFYTWAIQAGWQPGSELDRINNDEGYSPENCKWVSHKQQCRNRRSNRAITIDGVVKLMCEWEEEAGMGPKILAKWKNRFGEEEMTRRLIKRLNDLQPVKECETYETSGS